MLEIAKLLPSQDSLRHPEQIEHMVHFVRRGGRFLVENLSSHIEASGRIIKPNLIMVTQFEDGLLMARDGHHRIVAKILAGEKFLYDEEYAIEKMTYAMYEEINLRVGWATPFNPRTHVRRGNFCRYRTEVFRLFREASEEEAVRYILENKDMYCVPRTKGHSTFMDIFVCPRCEGEGEIHDADFSEGDSDHQMYLKQDTLRPCPVCKGAA